MDEISPIICITPPEFHIFCDSQSTASIRIRGTLGKDEKNYQNVLLVNGIDLMSFHYVHCFTEIKLILHCTIIQESMRSNVFEDQDSMICYCTVMHTIENKNKSKEK